MVINLRKKECFLKAKHKQRKINQGLLDTQNAQVCLFYIKLVAYLRTV